MIGAFERAERASDAAAREPWMTFVVIGAGPTGVEMAGTMTEIASTRCRASSAASTRSTPASSCSKAPTASSARSCRKLSQRAREQLERLGVEVRTGSKVTGIDAEGVDYETRDGDAVRHRIGSPRKTVIWAAGVAGSPLGAELARGTGATLDRAGRVVVEPDLSLAGHPEISVDRRPRRGEELRQGRPDAGARRQPRRQADGPRRRRQPAAPPARRSRPGRFATCDYGNLATVGRKAAVVDLAVPVFGALRFSGLPAWLFWLFAPPADRRATDRVRMGRPGLQAVQSFRRAASRCAKCRSNPARCDYLLLVDRKAVGVVEAKKVGTLLSGVAEQSAHYARNLPDFFKVSSAGCCLSLRIHRRRNVLPR